ncbi:MAG: hypothetical protein U5K37_00030 [Natrialbaceae archaeon]|nr:hypothetical protein [Natrialbaceae archaeon]
MTFRTDVSRAQRGLATRLDEGALGTEQFGGVVLLDAVIRCWSLDPHRPVRGLLGLGSLRLSDRRLRLRALLLARLDNPVRARGKFLRAPIALVLVDVIRIGPLARGPAGILPRISASSPSGTWVFPDVGACPSARSGSGQPPSGSAASSSRISASSVIGSDASSSD